MSARTRREPAALLDGACALCAAGVRFVPRQERPAPAPIRFVAIRSPEGARLAAAHGIEALDPDTFPLLEGGRALAGSNAALAVAARPSGPARLALSKRALPPPLRDAASGLLARHRHRLAGRARPVPSPERRHRFAPPPEAP